MVGSDEARAHDPCVPAPKTETAALPAASLTAFVVRVHGARLRSCLAWTFVKRGLPLLCFAFAVSIALPVVAFGCLVCASIIAAAELLFVFLRERRAMRSALLELHASGQPMGDLLLAWQESRGLGAQSDMAAWLSDMLAREVAGLEPGIERRWLRRGLGASRYLAPVAVALALMWVMRPSVAMPWFGMGGGTAASGGGGGGGAGGGGSNSPSQGGGGTDAQDPQDAQAQPRDDAPPNEPEEPQPREPQEQETQAPPQPPAPFLDLPANAEVVVPELTRDGETRRAMAMQASVAAGGAAETQGSASGQGGGGSDEASRTKKEEFERAQERALQSRRVPERERAIVRSFFEALRGASK